MGKDLIQIRLETLVKNGWFRRLEICLCACALSVPVTKISARAGIRCHDDLTIARESIRFPLSEVRDLLFFYRDPERFYGFLIEFTYFIKKKHPIMCKSDLPGNRIKSATYQTGSSYCMVRGTEWSSVPHPEAIHPVA